MPAPPPPPTSAVTKPAAAHADILVRGISNIYNGVITRPLETVRVVYTVPALQVGTSLLLSTWNHENEKYRVTWVADDQRSAHVRRVPHADRDRWQTIDYQTVDRSIAIVAGEWQDARGNSRDYWWRLDPEQ